MESEFFVSIVDELVKEREREREREREQGRN